MDAGSGEVAQDFCVLQQMQPPRAFQADLGDKHHLGKESLAEE
jgi:hypothetical protein